MQMCGSRGNESRGKDNLAESKYLMTASVNLRGERGTAGLLLEQRESLGTGAQFLALRCRINQGLTFFVGAGDEVGRNQFPHFRGRGTAGLER